MSSNFRTGIEEYPQPRPLQFIVIQQHKTTKAQSRLAARNYSP